MSDGTVQVKLPWSENQLHLFRNKLIQSYVRANGENPKSITCDDCTNPQDCLFAFDPYNTDGDCLGMK